MDALRKQNRGPEWFPAWAARLLDLYFSGTTAMFVLHGSVQENGVPAPAPGQARIETRGEMPMRPSVLWSALLGLALALPVGAQSLPPAPAATESLAEVADEVATWIKAPGSANRAVIVPV